MAERWTVVVDDGGLHSTDTGDHATEEEAFEAARQLATAIAQIHGWTVVIIGDGEWVECRDGGPHGETMRTFQPDHVGWENGVLRDR